MFELSDVEKRFLELMGIDVEAACDKVGGYSFSDRKSGSEFEGEVRYYGSSERMWKYSAGDTNICIEEEGAFEQSPKSRKITIGRDCTLEYVFDGCKKWTIEYKLTGIYPFCIESYIRELIYLYTSTSYAETTNIDSKGPYKINVIGSEIYKENGFHDQETIDFTPRNYEEVFESIIGELEDKNAKNILTRIIPLISINIPIDLLDTRINQIREKISKDPSEERGNIEIMKSFEEMKQMFQEYADSKTSDGGKSPLHKHPGEVQKN